MSVENIFKTAILRIGKLVCPKQPDFVDYSGYEVKSNFDLNGDKESEKIFHDTLKIS